MPCATRTEIFPGAYLTTQTTGRFGTDLLSISFLSKMSIQTAAQNAILPHLLRCGNAAYPTMEALAAELDALYGARIEPYVRKKGDIQSIGFVCDCIDRKKTPDGSNLLKSLIDLTGSLLTHPYLHEGAFCPDYTAIEKKNLSDRIAARMNDKRIYASKRMIEIMCDGQPYAVDELGSVESVRAIEADALYRHFEALLKTAPIELFYCGSEPHEKVAGFLCDAFASVSRDPLPPVSQDIFISSGDVKTVTETMAVSQGKLAMGFSTGFAACDPEYPALMLANAVFGAGTASKLFTHVRERLSLCYYAGSSMDKCKGVLTVSSGINADDFDAARTEILRQLDAVRSGDIDREEWDSAKATVLSALRGYADSPLFIEDFTLTQRAAGCDYDLDELIGRIEQVTLEGAVDAANKISLSTVYFLKGDEHHDESPEN